MKNFADEPSGFYRQIRIFLGPAAVTCLRGTPCRYRFWRKPDRDIAAPPQGVVVVLPIRHSITGLLDLIAAALVIFVGHGILDWFVAAESRHNFGYRTDLFNNATQPYKLVPLLFRLCCVVCVFNRFWIT